MYFVTASIPFFLPAIQPATGAQLETEKVAADLFPAQPEDRNKSG
jgi:hypothetical protein